MGANSDSGTLGVNRGDYPKSREACALFWGDFRAAPKPEIVRQNHDFTLSTCELHIGPSSQTRRARFTRNTQTREGIVFQFYRP